MSPVRIRSPAPTKKIPPGCFQNNWRCGTFDGPDLVRSHRDHNGGKKMDLKHSATGRMLKGFLICAVALWCGASAEAKFLFGISNSGGLYEIDTTTGAGSLFLAAAPGSN